MSDTQLNLTGLGDGHFPLAVLAEMSAKEDVPGNDRSLDGTVTIATLLDGATIDPRATHGTVISRDGGYTASIPVDVLRADGRLTVGNDRLRLTVVNGATLCWNVKDVGTIRFTIGPEADSVPENPPH
jgi:hypothetical protein